MSSKKSTKKGIIKPLAAAFLEMDPEEETTPSLHTPSTPQPRPARSPEPIRSIAELTKEETRVMLKEQLVSRISTEAPEKVSAMERLERSAAKKPESRKTEGKKQEDKKAEEKKPEKAPSRGRKEPAAPVKAAEQKPVPKKPEEKNAAAAAPVKATEIAEPGAELYIEYQGRSYNQAELVERAITIWVRKLRRGRANLMSLELYVKPQEQMVYYVFNKTRSGSFPL